MFISDVSNNELVVCRLFAKLTGNYKDVIDQRFKKERKKKYLTVKKFISNVSNNALVLFNFISQCF